MFVIKIAYKNLMRQLRKTFLVAFLCAAMSCFLCAYIGNIKSNQEQLPALAETIPVTAHISSLDGSMNIGLQIKDELIDFIERSGFAEDFLTTVQLAANFAPETPEEKIRPKRIQLSGVNDLAAFPSLTLSGDETVPDFLAQKDNGCIVDNFFLRRNNLAIGDEIALDLYWFDYRDKMATSMRYEYLAVGTLKIVGGFDFNTSGGDALPPDIVVPIDWLKTIFRESNLPFYASSCSFRVKDPLELNTFKAAMDEQRLMSVIPSAANRVEGIALITNDETFVRAASGIKNNLFILQLFSPLLMASIFVAGYVISHLIIQNRLNEFAVMRALGMGQARCLFVYLIESAVTSLSGGLIGVLFILVVLGAPSVSIMIALLGFIASYMSGTLIAVLTLGRVNVIRMLCGAE